MAFRNKIRGASRMRERGHKKLELWLAPNEFDSLSKALKEQGCSRPDFIRGAITYAIRQLAAGRTRCSGYGRFLEVG